MSKLNVVPTGGFFTRAALGSALPSRHVFADWVRWVTLGGGAGVGGGVALKQAENSDVFPDWSLAVAVTLVPATINAGDESANEARPAASVVTVVLPIEPWPCPN